MLNSGTNGFSISNGLTTVEQKVYNIILGMPKDDKALGVVVITGLAKDYDDLAAMVVLKELHRFGFGHLEAFIANLKPSRKRAIYGRAALDSLGLQDVPISVGTKASMKKHEEYRFEFDSPFMLDLETFKLRKETFWRMGPSSLIYTRKPPQDLPEGRYEGLHARWIFYLRGEYSDPRDDAVNNTFDWPAAGGFHRRLKNIPSDIYTKVAVYATNILASIFNDLGETKHPIGKDLQSRYQRQGVQFYKIVGGLKPVDGLTQERFLHDLRSFYEKHPPGALRSEKGTLLPDSDSEIIPYLTKGLQYDAFPSLATGGDNLVDALGILDTESMANQTSIHKIIGTPKFQDNLSANPNIHPE